MIGILARDHMGQQPRPWDTLVDWTLGQRANAHLALADAAHHTQRWGVCVQPGESRCSNARRDASEPQKQDPPSQVNRSKPEPKVKPGERYTHKTCHRAIQRACKKAKITAWTRLQIRHSCGTRIRKQYDLEAARVFLGQTKVSTTEIYAEQDLGLAAEVMRRIG